jgi:DNA-binding protein H-NS
MSLQSTVKQMHSLLEEIVVDLQKADHGNKAAAQRVRTGTVRLEKVAKVYRKESVADEKKGGTKKRTSSHAKKPAAKKAAHKPAKKAVHKKTSAKLSVAKKSAHHGHHPVRRATAKLPVRHHAR